MAEGWSVGKYCDTLYYARVDLDMSSHVDWGIRSEVGSHYICARARTYIYARTRMIMNRYAVVYVTSMFQ